MSNNKEWSRFAVYEYVDGDWVNEEQADRVFEAMQGMDHGEQGQVDMRAWLKEQGLELYAHLQCFTMSEIAERITSMAMSLEGIHNAIPLPRIAVEVDDGAILQVISDDPRAHGQEVLILDSHYEEGEEEDVCVFNHQDASKEWEWEYRVTSQGVKPTEIDLGSARPAFESEDDGNDEGDTDRPSGG